MSELQIEFDDHPARTRLPSAAGYPATSVVMFPDQRLIRINGIGAAYLSLTSGGVSFQRRYPPAVVEAVLKAVRAEFSELPCLVASMPPELPEEVTSYDE